MRILSPTVLFGQRPEPCPTCPELAERCAQNDINLHVILSSSASLGQRSEPCPELRRAVTQFKAQLTLVFIMHPFYFVFWQENENQASPQQRAPSLPPGHCVAHRR